MKKHLLGLALVSAFGLAGCGGGDGPAEPKIPDATGGEGSVRLTRPLFSPATSQIPVPNDLLFASSVYGNTTDLTLRSPSAANDRTDEIYIDPNPGLSNSAYAANHLFALDGWSAVAPFNIQFVNEGGASIDASTLVAGETVHVFKVALLRPEVAAGVPAPTGVVTQVLEVLDGSDFRVDVVAASEDTNPALRTIRITPINPLEEDTGYVVALSRGIRDGNQNLVVADGQFAAVTGTDPIDPQSSFAALEPVRQRVNFMLNAIDAHVPREEVTLAYQFRVQGVGDALNTISMMVNNPAAPAPVSSGFAPRAPFAAINPALDSGAVLWQGSVTVPYYLSAPTMSNPLAPIKEFWKADTTIAPGALLGTNLTYTNRIPKKTADETIPMLLAVPGGACVKPAGGWPVMIFQHGITGHRGQMLPIANTMAKSPICMATVAIDLPLHGLRSAADYAAGSSDQGLASLLHVGYTPGGVRERIFGVDYVNNTTGASGSDGFVDSSGAHFINLTSPLTSRDNLREAAADLLALSRALTVMDYDMGGADFDTSKLYFSGLSLGAITGAQFVSYDPRVKAAALVSPGGGLGKMVPVSPAFGPTINGGLAAAGRIVGTAGYEQFLFLLQTVVDQGDPLGNWQQFRAAGVPTLMFQVRNDLVVPNDGSALNYQVPASPPFPIALPTNVPAIAPYAGTTPLARAFGLPNLSADATNAEGVSGFIRFNTGCHGSLLTPATCAPATTDPTLALAVTVEMNSIIAKYFASNGALVDISNSAIIEN